ncbi:MAG: NifU family protein [Bryobacteraceae bacterium]|nr:NifU family protein [Bryobacteraceae bacterium]
MATIPSTPTLANSDLDQLAERVDRATAEVRTLPAESQAKAMALKSAIEEFHKIGLTKIVRRMKEDPRGKELLFELVDDPSVHALFSMHGLVRADLRTRVSRVLHMVRPYMQSHGGDVELVDVDETTVVVKLAGSCNGCSLSAVTLRDTVEQAIKQHLPQIQSVEVAPNEPEKATLGFVPLDSLTTPLKVEAGWAMGPLVSEVSGAELARWDHESVSVLIVQYQGEFHAYRNECAHLGMPLDGGRLDLESGILTCPWHGFRFDCASGECITAPEAQLEALPLRVERGRILVRTAK